jgi:hypothetical protein
MTVHSNTNHYNVPYVAYTSDQVSEFFELSIKHQLAACQSCYVLGGLLLVWSSRYVCIVLACKRHVEVFHAAVTQNYIQEGLRLNSETSSLILSKLHEYCIFIYHQYSDCCIGDTVKTKVARMYYKNFDENIMASGS